MIKITRRRVVIALALISGVSGELLAAFSMTRIAGPVTEIGGKLGFPAGAQAVLDLRWTLFAVVSVAAWAGAVLWTSPNRRDRYRGMPINIVAAALAGITIGLDHAVHADPGADGRWRLAAFVVGVSIALFSSVMVHVIANMTVEVAGARTTTRRIVRPRKVRRPRRPLAAFGTWVSGVLLTGQLRPAIAGAGAGGSGETGPDTETRDDDRRDEDTDDETDDRDRDDETDDRDDAPPSLTARAAAREWAQRNWRPDLRPAEVMRAMREAGTPIVRQEGSRVVQWARAQSWAQGSNGQEGIG